MSSMQASVGLSQLALIETFIANRQAYCRFYNERFADIPEVVTRTRTSTTWRCSSTSSGCRTGTRARRSWHT
jgi:dTDP-4-amino-4,6-dideoxygalactose transaminase